jgi:membrane protein DedA with SNARE-associated domain
MDIPSSLASSLVLYLGFASLATIKSGSLALLAGIAAQQGLVDGWVVALAIIGAGVLSDEVRYSLGARFGPRLLERFPALAARIDQFRPRLETHAQAVILFYRFFKSVRLIGAFAAGLLKVDRNVFSGLNFAGAVLWTAFWLPIGMFASETLGSHAAPAAIAGSLCLILIYGLWASIARQRRLV